MTHNLDVSSRENGRFMSGESVIEDVVVARTDIEPPPDGGYGWVCMAACFAVNCFTWGVIAVNSNKPNYPYFEASWTANQNVVIWCVFGILS